MFWKSCYDKKNRENYSEPHELVSIVYKVLQITGKYKPENEYFHQKVASLWPAGTELLPHSISQPAFIHFIIEQYKG